MLELRQRETWAADLCKLRGKIAENPGSVLLQPPIPEKYGFGPPPNQYISERLAGLASGGGGGGNRAPKIWGGGVGKRAPLTGTIRQLL